MFFQPWDPSGRVSGPGWAGVVSRRGRGSSLRPAGLGKCPCRRTACRNRVRCSHCGHSPTQTARHGRGTTRAPSLGPAPPRYPARGGGPIPNAQFGSVRDEDRAVSRTPREKERTQIMNSTENLSYDVFVNDPPPQDNGLLPNGEPKGGSPVASTLIYGSQDAVLTDPGFTEDQARALGDWVAAKGRNLTDIFITHGHGDHWFAAGLLAQRFGARIVASAGTIAQMHGNVATRPVLWDVLYQDIPPSPVTA